MTWPWSNSDLQLIEYSRTFSEFAYVRMFDFGWWEGMEAVWFDEEPQRVLIEVRDVLRAESLAWLRHNFTVEPGSFGWPAAITHRFSCGPQRIVIWEGDAQADWVLSGPSAGAVEALSRKLEGVW